MKKLVASSVSLALLLTSACTPILKEVRHTGGYPGYLLDKRTFDASRSKKLTLLRATIILAMAADMGRTTVSGQDGDAFAQLLKSAAEEINYAAADVYGTHQEACRVIDPGPTDEPASRILPKDDKGCRGFPADFETNLPRLESRIIKIMLAALPTDKARKFLDEAAKGNVLGAAWNALGAVAATAGGLHVAFARYRSGLEIVAAGVTCKGTQFDATQHTVVDAAKCLGLSDTNLFENPDEPEPEDYRDARISERAFFMLLRGVAEDCVSLDFAGKGSDLETSQGIRAEACNSIGFAPTPRPFRFGPGYVLGAPIDERSAPAGPDGKLKATPVQPAPVPAAPPAIPGPGAPARPAQ